MTTSWEIGTQISIDPATLILEGNPRTIGDMVAEAPGFVDNIGRHGVQEPITVYQEGDALRVADGFSRTLAALINGLTSVPVRIVAPAEGAELLIYQFNVNHQRRELGAADQARVLHDLSLFGLTGEQIAQSLSLDDETVRTGIAVHSSKTSKAILDKHPGLDMFQAGALVELDDDPEALASLEETLSSRPANFDHHVSQLRRDRTERLAVDEQTHRLREQGIVVVDDQYEPGLERLTDLLSSQTDQTPLSADPEGHRSCPGHVAHVQYLHFSEQTKVTYLCRNPIKHGHIYRYTSGATGSRGAKSENEKAELRRVKANNKDWRAAEDVRRTWLMQLLGRKSPPKKAGQFVAHALVCADHEIRKAFEQQHKAACALLGAEEPFPGKKHPLAPRAKLTASEATMAQLKILLCAYEAAADVHTWRNPTPSMQRYFTALQEWGYTLSDVESLVIDPAADSEKWPHLTHSVDDIVTTTMDDYEQYQADSSAVFNEAT